MGSTCATRIVKKAFIGWWWVRQTKWSWGWDPDYSGHWAPTRRCAERSARKYAKKVQKAAVPVPLHVVSLNPEDLR